MRASSPWTTRSCRVLVTLLLATRVSIFAYSASPAKSSMFKTILSPVNYRRRDRDEEDSGSAELEALKVLLPTLVSKSPIPAAESTGSDAAPRSSLFRRRATEDTSNSVKSTPNGNGNALSSLNPSDATFSSTAYTAASAAHQQQQQQQQGSPSSIISNTTAAWDVLRGGAVAGPNLLVATFLRFANFVGQTKARCFLLLLVSVFIESYATTLSKQAKDTGNALLFVRACFVYIMCMIGFNVSLAKLDVSVAYAVWSALGTTLVTAVGFFYFGESLDMTKILYLCMIVSGVIGLNLRG